MSVSDHEGPASQHARGLNRPSNLEPRSRSRGTPRPAPRAETCRSTVIGAPQLAHLFDRGDRGALVALRSIWGSPHRRAGRGASNSISLSASSARPRAVSSGSGGSMIGAAGAAGAIIGWSSIQRMATATSPRQPLQETSGLDVVERTTEPLALRVIRLGQAVGPRRERRGSRRRPPRRPPTTATVSHAASPAHRSESPAPAPGSRPGRTLGRRRHQGSLALAIDEDLDDLLGRLAALVEGRPLPCASPASRCR